MQYMPLGMCIGMSIGIAVGVALDNLSTYMCVGLSLGLCIGSLIHAQNLKKDKDTADDISINDSEDRYTQ